MTHGWTVPGDGGERADRPPPPQPYPPQPYPPQPYPPQPYPWQGYPPPGPQGWYAAPPAQRRLEPWAVVTLVVGAVALVPVAVVTGVVALVRIRRHDRRGVGFVVGGFAAAFVWLAVGAVVTLLVVAPGQGFFTPPVAGRSSQVPAPVGACVIRPTDPDGTWLQTSCSASSDGEVMAREQVGTPRQGWPGDDEAAWLVDDLCYSSFEGYTGDAYDDSPLDYEAFPPDRTAWESGDRTAVCVLVDPADRPGAEDGGPAGDV